MEAWLAPRLEQAPPSLCRRIVSAVREHPDASCWEGSRDEATPVDRGIPWLLQQVAEGLLEKAKTDPVGYETALTLLAADALVTYACQAVAETRPERLSDLR